MEFQKSLHLKKAVNWEIMMICVHLCSRNLCFLHETPRRLDTSDLSCYIELKSSLKSLHLNMGKEIDDACFLLLSESECKPVQDRHFSLCLSLLLFSNTLAHDCSHSLCMLIP